MLKILINGSYLFMIKNC